MAPSCPSIPAEPPPAITILPVFTAVPLLDIIPTDFESAALFIAFIFPEFVISEPFLPNIPTEVFPCRVTVPEFVTVDVSANIPTESFFLAVTVPVFFTNRFPFEFIPFLAKIPTDPFKSTFIFEVFSIVRIPVPVESISP